MQIRHLTPRSTVLNACRITQNKQPTFKEPSEDFIKKQIRLRHKTLELKRYEIIAEMPHFVYMHLRAHRSPNAFVGTRREDLQDKPRDPNEIVTAYLDVSAEDLLHMAEQRLCRKSHETTRDVMRQIIQNIATVEPLLADAMHPRCVVEGWCREDKCCKYMNTKFYKAHREQLINDYR